MTAALRGMPQINTPSVSCQIKSLQAFVAESRNHPHSVTYRLSIFHLHFSAEASPRNAGVTSYPIVAPSPDSVAGALTAPPPLPQQAAGS
jgi:hypothetical protein